MSATVPDTTAGGSVVSASAPRRPWPRLALNVGGAALELRGLTLFLRLAGAEIYVCTAELSDWWTLREPGSFEAAAGRLRLSAARATATHDP